MRRKICSIEQLELHDALIKLDSIGDNCIIIIANYFTFLHENLIAGKKINECRIILDNPEIKSFTLTGYDVYDDKNNFIYGKKSKVFYDVEAKNMFLEQLKKGFSVMGVSKQENNIFCLTSNDDPVFDVEFSFENAYIETDNLAFD